MMASITRQIKMKYSIGNWRLPQTAANCLFSLAISKFSIRRWEVYPNQES